MPLHTQHFVKRTVYGWVVDGFAPVRNARVKFVLDKAYGFTSDTVARNRPIYAPTNDDGYFEQELWCDQDSEIPVDWKAFYPDADDQQEPPDDAEPIPFSLTLGDGQPIAIGTAMSLGVGVAPDQQTLILAAVYAYILTLIASGIIAPGTADNVAPTTPASISATNLTSSSFRAVCAAASDNVAVTNYKWQIAGLSDPSFSSPLQTVNSGVNLYADFTGLAAPTTYLFRVRAEDAADNFSGWRAGQTTTGAGSGGDGEYLAPPRSLGSFIAFGDSLIYGANLSDRPNENLGKQAHVLASSPFPNFYNEGYPGAAYHNVGGGEFDLINSAATELYPHFSIDEFDFELVLLGSAWNDNNSLRPIGEYVRQELECVDNALANGAGGIIVVSAPMSGSTSNRPNYNAWRLLANYFKSIVLRRRGVYYADSTNDSHIGNGADTSDVSIFGADHLHKTALGYSYEAPYVRDGILAFTSDSVVPPVPSGLTLTPKSPARIDVAYTAATDNRRVKWYRLKINGGGLTDQIVVIHDNPYQLTLPQAGASYSIGIQAEDYRGNRSAWSAAQTASTLAQPTTPTPANLPSLRAHLKTVWKNAGQTQAATANGDQIASMKDESANNYHFVQATAENRPTLGAGAFGSHNGWNFTTYPANQSVENANIGQDLHNDFAIGFVLKKSATQGGDAALFRFGDGTGETQRALKIDEYTGYLTFTDGAEILTYATNICDGSAKVVVCTRRFNTITIRIDGAVVAARDLYLVDFTTNAASIGYGLVGVLSEFVICSAALEGGDLANLETYLTTLTI